MRRKSILIIFGLLMLTTSVGQNILAQIEMEKPKKGLQLIQPNMLNSGQKLELAIQLMKQNGFIGATDLLEQVRAEQPDNVEVINLLLACYDNLKAYDKAEILLTTMIEQKPFDYMFHDKLLHLYTRYNVDSMVSIQIDETLKTFPGNPDIYTSIIGKLIRGGYKAKAEEMIAEGRKKFDSEIMFAPEAALLYETQYDYYNAALEYVKAMRADSIRANTAERRLAALVRNPGAPQEIIKALNEEVKNDPNNTGILNALQQAYIKDNQFEPAFDLCLKVDSLTNQQGRNVFQYMRQCQERNLFEQVIKSARYIENLEGDTRSFADYKFYYGEALVGLNRYDSALAVYDDIYQNYMSSKDKAEALFNIGNIYRYNLCNYDSARAYYDIIDQRYNIEPWYSRAYYQKVMMSIVEGDLETAETGLTTLADRFKDNESKEMIEYQIGLLNMYKLDFENANLAFRKLIATYPRGYYVNDALMNSLIISETSLDNPEVLTQYAEALLFTVRLMPDSVEQKYNAIIDRGWTPLYGASSLKLAEYYVEQSDTARAIELSDRMEGQFQDDYFFPFLLKLKADILLKNEQKEKATEIYRRLLENYSIYPFSAEIREVMQEIQPETPST